MNLRRFSLITAFVLIALLFQVVPVLPNLNAIAVTSCNWAAFVSDVTIPDGSTFRAGTGQGFIKTWRLKNIGTCTWSTAYTLVFVKGDQLSYLSSSPLPKEVKPGETVDLSVPMQAPYMAGHYRGYWQLKSASGALFGIGSSAVDPFYVDIVVSDSTNAYDFAANVCAATWRSGAGVLPCPGTDGDSRGFVLSPSRYKMENGTDFTLPGLLLFPENKYNGYIQGTYPDFVVKSGDRFQSTVGCEYGSSCYVTFRLDYQVNNGPLQIFWKWSEANDRRTYRADLDLSSLAGKTVKFTLTLLASGTATGDRAILAMPFIVRTGGSGGPTSTITKTVTATATGSTPIPPMTRTVTATVSTVTIPPISPDIYYDFGSNACAAAWKSGAGALPCPGTDGDARGFVLPVSNPQYENGATDRSPSLILFPQNKYDGYIQGTYPEITIQAGDRFQSIVNCAYGSSCYVTFRLEYQVGNGSQTIFWTWKEKNEGLFYRVDKDLSALAGKKVKFTLTILATGFATGDRALWAQPRLIRTNYASRTPTPTQTLQSPKVTSASIEVAKPFSIACGGPNPMDVFGSITTNSPLNVTYHWELGGDQTGVSPDQVLSFSSAGTIPLHGGTYQLDCGSYTARLVVTSPNYYSALIYFNVTQTNSLVSSTPTITRTPYFSCTAPVCTNGALVCGDTNGCPGGCGTVCLTYTPTLNATVTPTATISPTPTGTATQAVLIGPYAVVSVAGNDVLNVRSGPGTGYGIVSSFAWNARDIWRTGPKSGDWVEVQRPGGTGWVNSYYLTEQISSGAFCADTRVNTLLTNLGAALKSSSGTSLAGLVNARHGLAMSLSPGDSKVVISKGVVPTLFTSTTSYNWGAAEGTGMSSVGTFSDVMLPLLLDVFNAGTTPACNDDTIPSNMGQPWPYPSVNFYAVKGATDFPWRIFMVGIEYLDGSPYLQSLLHAQWGP